MTDALFYPKQNPDDLYETFNKSLYKLTGSEAEDDIMEQLQAEPGVNNSSNVTVSASDLGSGVDTSTTISATGNYSAGKKMFDNTSTGFILGVDPKDGLSKFYIGTTTNYFNYDGSTLAIVGNSSAAITLAQTGVSTANLVLNSNGMVFKVGPTTNVTILLSSGSSTFNGAALNIQVGDDFSTNAINVELSWQSNHVGDFSPATSNGTILDLGQTARRWRTIYLTNAPDVVSDIRLKNEVRVSRYGLAEVLKMRPIQYEMDNRQSIGFSAQEMKEIVPEVVSQGEEGYYSMRYDELVPVLVSAVKELSAQVDALREKLGL